jgi:hypothetical protein
MRATSGTLRSSPTIASAAAARSHRTRVTTRAFDPSFDGGSPPVADPWHARRYLLHALLSAPTPDVPRLSALVTRKPRPVDDTAPCRA